MRVAGIPQITRRENRSLREGIWNFAQIPAGAMEFDGFTTGLRPAFRSLGLDAMDTYVSVSELLASPSKMLKRSLFMDCDSSSQYLQGYSPSRKKSRDMKRDSPSNFFGTSDIASYIAGTTYSREDLDETYLESVRTSSAGPTPDLTIPPRSRSDSSATQTSEFRSGCRGVSWNRRMKAWLAFWTEGKVRRSKTFNTKSMGFEKARDAAIEFLVGKKAQLNTHCIEDSQSGSSGEFSDDKSLNLFDDYGPRPFGSPWGMEEAPTSMRL